MIQASARRPRPVEPKALGSAVAGSAPRASAGARIEAALRAMTESTNPVAVNSPIPRQKPNWKWKGRKTRPVKTVPARKAATPLRDKRDVRRGGGEARPARVGAVEART